MQSENIMLADKYKIEKEQNAQLRNQVAQLLQSEQEQKIQMQQQDLTNQTLQVIIILILISHLTHFHICFTRILNIYFWSGNIWSLGNGFLELIFSWKIQKSEPIFCSPDQEISCWDISLTLWSSLIQEKVTSLESQINGALLSSEGRLFGSEMGHGALPGTTGDGMDSSAVTKKLEEELKKRDTLIEVCFYSLLMKQVYCQMIFLS